MLKEGGNMISCGGEIGKCRLMYQKVSIIRSFGGKRFQFVYRSDKQTRIIKKAKKNAGNEIERC